MHRLRGLVASLTGAAVLAVAASAAAAPVVVGAGPKGTTVLSFDGTVAEAGQFFTLYGHLTGVRGWSDATVFAGARRPSLARLTFVATTELQVGGRSTVGLRRFSVKSRGTLRIFLQTTPGTTPDDPLSYTSGTPVAMADAKLKALFIPVARTGTTVRAVLTGGLVIRQSRPFSIGGVQYQLGSPGMRVRVAANGNGIVKDIYLPAAEVNIAGRATVTR
jgi:hypothetical protein